MNDLVDVLAAFRLTRLVTRDTITRPARTRIIRYAYESSGRALLGGDEAEIDEYPHTDQDAPKLAAFIICPWCVSTWCSIFVVCARRRFPQVWSPIATALALSSATGLLARLDD